METNKTDFAGRGNQKKQNIAKYQAPEVSIIYENVQKVPKSMTIKDILFICQCLKSHFLFFNLSETDLEGLVSKMFYCQCISDEFIFKQNDDASSFFLIETGYVEVIVNNQVKKVLKPGECFGEIALLYHAKRSASIRAKDNLKLWGIDRSTFRKAVEEMAAKEYSENRAFIENIELFQNLTWLQKDSLASALSTLRYKKNQVIVTEGEPGSSYYIIKHGSVAVLKGEKEVRTLSKQDSFGEQALYNEANTRTMTVKSVDDNLILLSLGKDQIFKILGDGLQNIIYRNNQKWALESNPLLSRLTKIQMEKFNDRCKIFIYKKGEVVLRSNSLGINKILTVMRGTLIYGPEVFGARKIFNENFLLEKNKNKKLDYDLVAGDETVVSEITVEDFEEIIGGFLEIVLSRNEKSHEKKMTALTNLVSHPANSVKLDDLIFLKKLGFGQFGSVYLVKPKNKPDLYALKCVSKQQVLEQKLDRHVQQERLVLTHVNFPFIMEFIRTYKDDYQVFFLLEYIKGMELFDVIREIGLLSTYDCQFYIGSMILAIEYLHIQNIIYRDLKPENIMIDYKGFLKLVDMGTAKILKTNGKESRTFTIIGTPHYMAPEVITGKGYSFLVDLWSIGICLYEFMCGMVPYGEDVQDPYEIYEEINRKSLSFPNYVKDKAAKFITVQLLSKIPELRLGSSFAALKANAWFNNFDWDKLMDKELKPPFLPPKDKMISDIEIQKQMIKERPVIDEIKAEQGKAKKVLGVDWDKDF